MSKIVYRSSWVTINCEYVQKGYILWNVRLLGTFSFAFDFVEYIFVNIGFDSFYKSISEYFKWYIYFLDALHCTLPSILHMYYEAYCFCLLFSMIFVLCCTIRKISIKHNDLVFDDVYFNLETCSSVYLEPEDSSLIIRGAFRSRGALAVSFVGAPFCSSHGKFQRLQYQWFWVRPN